MNLNPPRTPASDAMKARVMLIVLCLAWGLTWPAMRFALIDLPPFTMRATSALIGTLSLIVLARLAGRPVYLPPRAMWADIVVVALFNIIIFGLCTAFAQMLAYTGRVAIIVYTMPIWACLFARIMLHELLTRMRAFALLLCIVGMGVLIYPLAVDGIPLGLLLALGAAVSWAFGTIYVKWRRMDLDPFTLAAWQLVLSFIAMAALVPFFESSFHISDVRWPSVAGVVFSGLFGSGIAYFLWFHIIRLIPATTASLAALSAPVIGLVSSMVLLNEIPTTADVVGFVLIFAASLCALVQPGASRKRPARPAT
jgi:drug/metabolite transporter (DMT)-like permease